VILLERNQKIKEEKKVKFFLIYYSLGLIKNASLNHL